MLRWSFAELDGRANRLAHLLASLGAAPGTKVATLGQNSAGIVASTHAVRRTGATCVPLNYRLTVDEATYVVDNSDASILYVDEAYVGIVDAVRPGAPGVRHVVVFDERGELVDPELAGRAEASPIDAAPVDTDDPGMAGPTMIYTSGTTGRPKGAVRAAVGGGAQMAGLVALIGYVAEDVYLTTGPLYHSGPGGFAALAHAVGSTVVTQYRFDPTDWLRLVETHRVTTTFAAPTPIRMICSLPDEVKGRHDRSSMRRLIANAAPWSQTLKKRYLADFPPDSLWEVYGSTELGVDCVLGPADHLRKPGSCGRPAPGVEIILVDEQRREITEPHVNGELFVRAAGSFSEYYKAPEKYDAGELGVVRGEVVIAVGQSQPGLFELRHVAGRVAVVLADPHADRHRHAEP